MEKTLLGGPSERAFVKTVDGSSFTSCQDRQWSLFRKSKMMALAS